MSSAQQPSTSDPVIIVVALSVGFAALGCVAIFRKAVLEPSKLRVACIVMGVLVVILAVCNALRVESEVAESAFVNLRTVTLLLFVDLMVAITFKLGGRFYTSETRVNKLYWLAIGATGFVNVLSIVTIILDNVTLSDTGANAVKYVDDVNQLMWPVAVFFAYWYAFDPVINTTSGSGSNISPVVTVGLWYLLGMGLLLFLHIITISVSIPYMAFKRFSIVDSAIACIIRSTMLAFYSFPPSNGLNNFIRHRFFPNSLDSPDTIAEVPSSNQPDRSEMSMSMTPLNRLPISSENPTTTTAATSRPQSLAISPV